MKRLFTVVALALTAVLLALPAAANAGGPACSPRTLATFPAADYGSFLESMAMDSHGTLFCSVTTWADSNTGQLWQVTPNGKARVVATLDLTAYGQLMGVAIDPCDRVYVAVADNSSINGVPDSIGSGVYVLRGNSLLKVAVLPSGSFPNGMAFHDGRLCITDSYNGCVWRVAPGGGLACQATRWLSDRLLQPAGNEYLGVDGIAFLGDQLYLTNWSKHTILRSSLAGSGSPGRLRVAYDSPDLYSADGLAFDALGDLWITTDGIQGPLPSGGLSYLTPSGRLVTVAKDPGWLNYPTMPVFGTSPATRHTLFICNGAFWSGYGDGTVPGIQALTVPVTGLPSWLW